MTLSIEQIEQQIAELQKTLEALKNPKLEITRQFTGQYFSPYQGKQYRRMESDGIPIWELFNDDWIKLDSQQSENLEMIYLEDCCK
jgi:hypothetical protein